MIPKIKLPYYPITLPDNNKTIHIKPYTIEIEKYLTQLDDKSDMKVQLNAIAEILKYCIVEDDINVNELYIGTVFWLYLKCYEISVKDTIEFQYNHKCDKDTISKIDINIKIKDIKYDCDNKPLILDIDTEEGKYLIEFSSLKLKGLQYLNIDNDNADVQSSISLISSCLDRMYDQNGNNELDLTDDDKIEIISNLSLGQIEKITNKISNISKPEYQLDYKCPKCDKHIKETITDFFI